MSLPAVTGYVLALLERLKEKNDEKKLIEKYGTDPQSFTFNYDTEETMVSLEKSFLTIRHFQESDPFAAGFPAVSVDAIMAYEHKRIRRLYDASGLSPADAGRHLLPVIQRLISCIHLIPASGSFHHCGVGGLIEHSLDAAYIASQNARNVIFPAHEFNCDRLAASRWPVGVGLGCLCHDAAKVLCDVRIKDADSNRLFQPYSERLDEFLVKNKSRRYRVTWIGEGKHHEEALTDLFHYLLGEATIQWLGERIAKELSFFFRGKTDECTTRLPEIITKADGESVAEDRRRGQFDRSPAGSEDREIRNFFASVRRLLAIAQKHTDKAGDAETVFLHGLSIRGWTINTPNSALLLTPDRKLFIAYGQLKEIRKIYELENISSRNFTPGRRFENMSEDELAGELTALIDCLNEAGMLEAAPAEAGAEKRRLLWKIGRFNPLCDSEDDIEPFEALCLNSKGSALLFRDNSMSPEPVSAYAVFSGNRHNIVSRTESFISAEDPADSSEGTSGTESESDVEALDEDEQMAAAEASVIGLSEETDDDYETENSDSEGEEDEEDDAPWTVSDADALMPFSAKPKKVKAERNATEEIAGPDTHDEEEQTVSERIAGDAAHAGEARSFGDGLGAMSPEELVDALVEEMEGKYESGEVRIFREQGKVWITSEHLLELCEINDTDHIAVRQMICTSAMNNRYPPLKVSSSRIYLI